MNHRLGVCSACKAQYKVPASFQADRAKCKACGGVVEIGPVGGAAPTAAAKPAPKPAPAAPARPVPARPVAAVSNPAPKPAPKPVTEATDNVRAAAAAAAERVRDAGRKSAPVSATEGERKPEAREHAKAGARGGAKAGAKAGGGRHGARKEKSKAPMLAAVVVLMAAGGGAAWFLTRGGGEGSQAAETSPDVAAAPAESAPEPTADATDAAPVETPVAETPVAGADTASDAPAAETPPAAKPADEDIDLSVFPDEPKLPGTSDEDWASIQEWTATFLDANAGAAGNRARGKLLERGRESFPAVLNAMKRLDFSTDDGFRAGDLSQRYLMAVCNGSNFDWKYEQDPAAVLFNKKVVRFWIKSWQQAREEPKAWAKLTKTTEEEALKLFAVTGPFDKGAGASPEAAGASSALDDL